ncbi:TPR repeat-containing protein YrrB [Aquisphaera giovannonii]|uniref:TPR repeat-containing protein YrrB n=1 Tax=Aquisphaera giovannonii TaxID=406548 RepID=A0A5B9W8A3_9BACT|nr:tetratricopeptide repeat protein [Aquisphaera giovannonii]QEH36150.1 TPR repeat-containing protein YrrB [Aquisphaera giovannonii]
MALPRIRVGLGMMVLLVASGSPSTPAGSVNDDRDRAFRLYDAGRFAEAIPLLDRVIEAHHRDVQGRIKRGNCYLRLDRPERAVPDFEFVARFSPFNPSAQTDLGIALLMIGRHQDAQACFEQAIRYWSNPLNGAGALNRRSAREIRQGRGASHCGLAQVYHRTGRNEEAIAEYNRALAIFAEDPNTYIGRGDAHASLGEEDEAFADYAEAIRIGPAYSRAYVSRATLLARLGRADEALADYERALAIDPNDALALGLRGGLLSQRGQNDRALADFEAVLGMRPEDAGAHKDRGGLLVRMGRNEEAIADLDRAISLNPRSAASYLNRGAAHSNLGHYEQAIADLERAIDLDPKDPKSHTNIGLALFMVGSYDRSIEELSEAVRLAPRNAIVRMNRGNVYAKLGFREQAIADYGESERADPRLMASLGGPSRLLETMGRQSLAMLDQKRVTLSKPGAGEASAALERGHALRARGDWKAAIAEFDRAIGLDPGRPEAYVARGWSRFCAGEPDAEADAQAYLKLRGWDDRFSPYMALLGVLSARRAGHEEEGRRALDEAIAGVPPGLWPLPLLHYLRHDITGTAVLEKAKGETQQAEAHAVVGLDLLRRGDRKGAIEHLRWVRDHGPSKSVFFDVAGATLRDLDTPLDPLSRAIRARRAN